MKTMKHSLRILLAICALATINCQLSTVQALSLNGVEYRVDTLMHIQVGPGAWYTQLRMTNQAGTYPHNVFLMHVDAKNPYISFESVLAKDSLEGTERPSAMAKRKTTASHHLFGGVNADFFTTGSSSIAEGTACYLYGRPSGGVIVEHEVTTLQNNRRQSFAVDQNNNPYIGAITRQMKAVVNGDSLTIYNINYSRSKNCLTLFNHWNGKRSTACTAGTEVLLAPVEGENWSINHTTRCVVEQVAQNNGRMAIPEGKVVLSGNGTMATPLNALATGDTVDIVMDMLIGGQRVDIAHSVGGPDATKYAQMLRGGVVVADSIWASNEPRTGIGYSVTRDTIIFCVCDGRTNESTGVSTYVEGEIMKAYGAWDAVNVDGGGSSCLYLEPFGKPMNNPSDGSERAVGDGFFAVCSAPEDATLARLSCYTPDLYLPQYGYSELAFLGYNQYDVLLSTHVEDVQLSCAPEVGYFMPDGKFVALADGPITATKDGITTTVQLHILTEAVAQFRLDSVLLNRASAYSVEIFSQVGLQQIGLLPQSLTWTSEDPTIAEVSDEGVVTAVASGRTRVVGTIGQFSDTLVVIASVVDNPYITDSLSGIVSGDWTIKASNTKWNTTVTTNAENRSELTFSFKQGRLPNLKFTYNGTTPLLSSPDFIELRLHSDAFPLAQAIISVTDALGDNHTFTIDTTDISGEMRLIVPVRTFTGGEEDYSIFPLTMKYFTLYLNASAPEQEYHLTFDGIYLYYGSLTDSDSRVESLPWEESHVVKLMEGGQVILRCDDASYNLLGTRIR